MNAVEHTSDADHPALRPDESGSAHPDPDESVLIECLRKGVDRCYEIFVRRFGPVVLTTARRYLRSDADAADCFQETFLAAFDGIHEFEERSSLGGWLRGITVKKSLMRIRSRERRKEESIDHLLPEFDTRGKRVQGTTAAPEPEAGDALDEARLRLLVREKIDELPEDYRTTLLLRDIDGYSTRETAEILGIQENAVKTRLHRARSALRTLLEPALERLG